MNIKEQIEKRLRATKVTESGVDPKANKAYDSYLLGMIRAYENVLSDIQNLTSGGSEELSNVRPESFESNNMNGLVERFKNYDLTK